MTGDRHFPPNLRGRMGQTVPIQVFKDCSDLRKKTETYNF